MVALFVGGPLDSLSFTPDQVNQVAEILPTYSESGHRNFLLMPSPAGCTQILRGQITKRECQEPRHTYEQLRKADGSVEYHYAEGALGHALRQKTQPLSEEQVELKKAFAAAADKFIEQLRSAAMSTNTEVNLVRRLRDRQGNTVDATPVLIVSKPILTGFGDSEEKFATAFMLDQGIANINSLVRNAPTDFVDYTGDSSRVLQIFDFEMLIQRA